MEERGMNERIKKLRRVSMETAPHIDLERARIETEVYKKYEGKVSVPVLRALVLKEYFSRKTLYLGEGELIVGEKGNAPQASPTFPELCCHSEEDMHVMNDRELVSFKVTEEDIKNQVGEIIPYWTGRTVREHLLNQMMIRMPRGDIRLVRFVIEDPDHKTTRVDFSEIYFTVKKTTRDKPFLFQKNRAREP